jgi:L-seryl-tRNA(Ser) seleniumtransferase
LSGKQSLRYLPKVDEVLKAERLEPLFEAYGRTLMVDYIREGIQGMREALIQDTETAISPEECYEQVLQRIIEIADANEQFNLRPVINATGIVLHTNLGRAVLSKKAREAVYEIGASYNNLELALESGERGSRYSHVLDLLKKVTGCEDALVVNNNAAAVLLVLSTLAKGKEAIISRGQLVEIGGSFRIPEVMEASGGYLKEVGTTNKTHLRDYTNAIGEDTAVLLKVHTSNYRVVGFTQEVATEELVALAEEKGLIVVEDLGSGLLFDLKPYHITDEPTVQEVVKAGVHVITFSGDKLMGGPQAGIIIGKKEYISQMKKNPLTRALRVDKLTFAALEATLKEYLDLDQVGTKNPTLRMLTLSQEALQLKAKKLQDILKSEESLGSQFNIEVETGYSQAGGGSLPTTNIPTYLVTLEGSISLIALAHALRVGKDAVLARINQNKLILDVRTIFDEDLLKLKEALKLALESLEN